MIIQHNVSAEMATHANGRNVAGLKQTTERLSTGYQINRAADNASGLSVTEKMRSQIRGLSKATHNANDAISLIQTAEGALNETEDLLQRMRELSVQSANGTYTEKDRMDMQHEVDALKEEIDRISMSTEFNEMKLLNGEIKNTRQGSSQFCEYGARYGSINYDLAIGGGKITVASEMRDVALKFTTGASGKGGENAFYTYELDRTHGDLTQTITINLAAGQRYTDEQIQKLIDNANYSKDFQANPSKVYFNSSYGFINAAACETYGIQTGGSNQQMTVSTTAMATNKSFADANVTYSTIAHTGVTETFTINCYINNNTGNLRDFSIDSTSNTINVDTGGALNYTNADRALTRIKEKLTEYCRGRNTDSSNNYYLDENGAKVNNGKCTVTGISDVTIEWDRTNRTYYYSPNTITVTRTTQQRTASIQAQSAYDFTITADKPGSYADYVEDDEIYREPDVEGIYNMQTLSGLTITSSDSVSDNVSLSVNSSSGLATVTLKKGYTATGGEIASQIESLLRADGYEYSVSSVKNSATIRPADNSFYGLDDTVNVIIAGNDPDFVVGNGSVSATITNAGERGIKRSGTVAGVRQEFSGNLTSLMINAGDGTGGSSDRIKFTADSYGAYKDYDSLIGTFKINTNQTLEKGKEHVDVNGEVATIYLATGTEYTNRDIEKLLKGVGLSYTVELTDCHNPDGDKDGAVYFNSTGEVTVAQSVAGVGLGFEDISYIKDKIEFQVGANGVEDQRVGMDLIDASSSAIGVANVNITTQEKANESIEYIDAAISKVSKYRADMGAVQNRMEHTLNSLNTAQENLSAAESQMRDTDIASEMVKHTRNQILQRSSQALLAQASHKPEGILSMLR